MEVQQSLKNSLVSEAFFVAAAAAAATVAADSNSNSSCSIIILKERNEGWHICVCVGREGWIGRTIAMATMTTTSTSAEALSVFIPSGSNDVPVMV